MAEDEYIVDYDGYSRKVEKPDDEPQSMIDYTDQSTEGVGQGYNQRFDDSSSSSDTSAMNRETPHVSWWRRILRPH